MSAKTIPQDSDIHLIAEHEKGETRTDADCEVDLKIADLIHVLQSARRTRREWLLVAKSVSTYILTLFAEYYKEEPGTDFKTINAEILIRTFLRGVQWTGEDFGSKVHLEMLTLEYLQSVRRTRLEGKPIAQSTST